MPSTIISENWDSVTPPTIPSGWTADAGLVTNSSGSIFQSSPNAIKFTGSTSANIYRTTDKDTNGDQQVSAKFYLGVTSTAAAWRLVGRIKTPPVTTCYFVGLATATHSQNGVTLWKTVSGATAQLGSTVGAGQITAATWFYTQLVCVGTTQNVYVQAITGTNAGLWLNSSGAWQSSKVACLTAADTAVAGQATAGLRVAAVGTATNFFTDDFLFEDLVVAGLTAGTLTANPIVGEVDLSWTTAVGGTAPYTYQVQRAPDAGGTPGTFANLGSSQSGLTYNDMTGTPGVIYWYQVVVTDAVSATATYSAVAAAPLLTGTFWNDLLITTGAMSARWSPGNFSISSGHAKSTLTGDIAAWSADFDSRAYGPDYFVQAVTDVLPASNTDSLGVIGRYYTVGAAVNYYLALFRKNTTPTAELWKSVSGTLTQLGTSTNITWAAGDVLRLEMAGDTITVLQNGVSRVSVTDTAHHGVHGTAGLRQGTGSSGSFTSFAAGYLASTTNLVGGADSGAVTDTTATIGFRASAACTVTIDYSTSSTLATFSTSGSVSVTSTTDFTGAITLTGLTPAITYYYRVNLNGVAKHVAPFPQTKTAPSLGATVLKLAFGSCGELFNNLPSTAQGDKIWPAIDAVAPDLAIHLGDSTYQDVAQTHGGTSSTQGGPPPASSLANFRATSRIFKSPGTQNVNWSASRVKYPWLYVPDDHDYVNNIDNVPSVNSPYYANGEQAWKESFGKTNPQVYGTSLNYDALEYGNIGIFLCDLRSFRSANSATDNSSKTILGATQKAALKSWLSTNNSRYPIKIIACSVLPASYGTTGNDCWGGGVDTDLTTPRTGFSTERDEIREYIRVNAITGVVWIAGDQHWGGSFKETANSHPSYTFLSSAFNTSNLSPTPTTPDAVNGPVFWKYSSGVHFGLVTIDTTVTPATVAFQLYGPSGSLGSSFLTSLTATDINSGLPSGSAQQLAMMGCGA